MKSKGQQHFLLISNPVARHHLHYQGPSLVMMNMKLSITLAHG